MNNRLPSNAVILILIWLLFIIAFSVTLLQIPNDLSPSIYSFNIVFYIVIFPYTFSIIFIPTFDFDEDDELA